MPTAPSHHPPRITVRDTLGEELALIIHHPDGTATAAPVPPLRALGIAEELTAAARRALAHGAAEAQQPGHRDQQEGQQHQPDHGRSELRARLVEERRAILGEMEDSGQPLAPGFLSILSGVHAGIAAIDAEAAGS